MLRQGRLNRHQLRQSPTKKARAIISRTCPNSCLLASVTYHLYDRLDPAFCGLFNRLQHLLLDSQKIVNAMSLSNQEYSVNQEIADFFGKTSATRSACDARAKELVGGNVTPVAVQGACSYSVYAGPGDDFVVQFRLSSLKLSTETTSLSRKIYGSLVPQVLFKGQIGEFADDKEPLYIYVMSRVQGVSHLDFILARNQPDNSPENLSWRKTLIADIARYDGF